MTGHGPDGILRVAHRIATTILACRVALGMMALWIVIVGWGAVSNGHAQEQPLPPPSPSSMSGVDGLKSTVWNFRRTSETNLENELEGWTRYQGSRKGYPNYVKAKIEPRNPEFARRLQVIDTEIVKAWPQLRKQMEFLPPLPPAFPNLLIDRYLGVTLDGGRFGIQSPVTPASSLYQYRFSCDITTQGLRRDTARAEFVFLDKEDNELATYPTPEVTGTTQWTTLALPLIRPPKNATKIFVRLLVDWAEDGQADIRGKIGFDNIRIEQYPQLQLATDEQLGVYRYGARPVANAKIMGLPENASRVRFQLFDQFGERLGGTELDVTPAEKRQSQAAVTEDDFDSEVSWPLPRLRPGFYRVTANLKGYQAETLSTETTFAIINDLVDGPPHGCFGWTLPDGNLNIEPKQLASWMESLGVAWVKYPCWLDPNDSIKAEETVAVFSKLQDAGIQTVGMLDRPPENQVARYGLRSRRDLVAAQLFRDLATWQPMLEPVMTLLTLKVRTWQLGADGDHSFLGRPRLRESVQQISTGLQGFGQPIDVAISWPWMERELSDSEASWQAVCRTSDPPLSARELDQFLDLAQRDSRSDGPRTWLQLNPIRKSKYDTEARIRDLVLRMVTVRNHRVQAAFVTDPRDPEQGLLTADGRPSELLLPWRTTSRMVGNLRRVGSLQLRSGAKNGVFIAADRAVLVLWSDSPTEERIFLGDDVKAVDVWGRVKSLPVEPDPLQPGQRIKIGRLPTFIIGADPKLLAFRMSVGLDNDQLDSLLGRDQNLTIEFTNPTRDSLIGSVRVLPPRSWRIESPRRDWEALPGANASQTYQVVLSNTATIGEHPFPIQFELETLPPRLLTVYRTVKVGPSGLEMKVTTRLLPSGELRVQVTLINSSQLPLSYECVLWPPSGRQYKRRFVTIKPGEEQKRDFFWADGDELIGKQMLLRAVEEDGQRVLNYAIDVTR